MKEVFSWDNIVLINDINTNIEWGIVNFSLYNINNNLCKYSMKTNILFMNFNINGFLLNQSLFHLEK